MELPRTARGEREVMKQRSKEVTKRMLYPLPPVFCAKSAQGTESEGLAGNTIFKRVRKRMKRKGL